MGPCQGQAAGLHEIVGQDQLGDRVFFAAQQFVPLRRRDQSLILGRAEQDFEVDLVIAAVDPRGVVDEVGVDQAAVRGVLDAAQMRQAKVAAFADDPGTKL